MKFKEENYDGTLDYKTIDDVNDRNPIIVHDVPYIEHDGDKLISPDDVLEQMDKENFDYVEEK